MNKAQHTTRYIKHLAESANFKVSTFNKLRNGLIENGFELPNVSYTNPLGATLRMSAQTSADTRKIKKDEEV
ncbi:hypothetical protein SDC9_56556 [bioreactor metagenome]|uniref:Uncharacterized protein n=1 Tax=bioreactor metagenome TaxID=1076179 RepID=A0A644X365_9ZZZZ